MDEVPVDRSKLNPVVQRVLDRGDERRRAEGQGPVQHNAKQNDTIVTREFLEFRTGRASVSGYAQAKWIHFCETMLNEGFDVTLYEAKATFSKYITVWDRSRKFRVRFSDHKPIKFREMNGDCDFFVGKCNRTTTNTDQAIEATLRYFCGEPSRPDEKGNDAT